MLLMRRSMRDKHAKGNVRLTVTHETKHLQMKAKILQGRGCEDCP